MAFYSNLSKKDAIKHYKSLFVPRAVEDRMLLALRQGVISKWFSSYGQEVVSVANTLAMHEDEWICTMHRNLECLLLAMSPYLSYSLNFKEKLLDSQKGVIVRFILAVKNIRYLE